MSPVISELETVPTAWMVTLAIDVQQQHKTVQQHGEAHQMLSWGRNVRQRDWPLGQAPGGARRLPLILVQGSNYFVTYRHPVLDYTDAYYYIALCKYFQRYSASQKRESGQAAPNLSCHRTMKLLVPMQHNNYYLQYTFYL